MYNTQSSQMALTTKRLQYTYIVVGESSDRDIRGFTTSARTAVKIISRNYPNLIVTALIDSRRDHLNRCVLELQQLSGNTSIPKNLWNEVSNNIEELSLILINPLHTGVSDTIFYINNTGETYQGNLYSELSILKIPKYMQFSR
jgi:hypothetical protein